MNTSQRRTLHEIVGKLQRVQGMAQADPLPSDVTMQVDVLLADALDDIRWVLQVHEWPRPTAEEPDLDTIESWLWDDSGCEATDGCWVEPDGTCPHGHVSWLLRLGWI